MSEGFVVVVVVRVDAFLGEVPDGIASSFMDGDSSRNRAEEIRVARPASWVRRGNRCGRMGSHDLSILPVSPALDHLYHGI